MQPRALIDAGTSGSLFMGNIHHKRHRKEGDPGSNSSTATSSQDDPVLGTTRSLLNIGPDCTDDKPSAPTNVKYYVNRFVDRNKTVQYAGLGVGHRHPANFIRRAVSRLTRLLHLALFIRINNSHVWTMHESYHNASPPWQTNNHSPSPFPHDRSRSRHLNETHPYHHRNRDHGRSKSQSPPNSDRSSPGSSHSRQSRNEHERQSDSEDHQQKTTSSKKSADLDPFNDTEAFMLKQGRVIGRMVAMWKPLRGILEVGIQNSNLSDAERDNLPESVQNLLMLYIETVVFIPSLPEVILAKGPESIEIIARNLDRGRSNTRSSDIHSIKAHIYQWREWNPPFKTSMPHTLGFNNASTGALLCPANLNWTDPTVREGLRRGTIRAGPRDLPIFLWKNESCDPSPNRVLVGFLQGDLLVRGVRHLLIAPSAAHRAGSSRSTRRSNASIHGISYVSGYMIAYTACLIHFVLSSQSAMAAGSSNDPERWRYDEFYRTVIRTMKAMPESSVAQLLGWWKETIFCPDDDDGDDESAERNGSLPSIATIIEGAKFSLTIYFVLRALEQSFSLSSTVYMSDGYATFAQPGSETQPTPEGREDSSRTGSCSNLQGSGIHSTGPSRTIQGTFNPTAFQRMADARASSSGEKLEERLASLEATVREQTSSIASLDGKDQLATDFSSALARADQRGNDPGRPAGLGRRGEGGSESSDEDDSEEDQGGGGDGKGKGKPLLPAPGTEALHDVPEGIPRGLVTPERSGKMPCRGSRIELKGGLELFGPNKLESEEQNAFLQVRFPRNFYSFAILSHAPVFLSFMWNRLSWVMEAAALLVIALSNGDHRPPDWPDFVGIVFLLFVNSSIGFYEERNAGNAVKALMDSLAPKAKVERNGSWSEIESADLVPGDMVSFKIRDIVAADCRVPFVNRVRLKVPSLPLVPIPSSAVPPPSSARTMTPPVTCRRFLPKSAPSVLCRLIFSLLPIFSSFTLAYRRGPDNILVLLIGGISIAMPTVLSVTLAVGAQQLAKYKAIVTRIEELAGVTILCSDKRATTNISSSLEARPPCHARDSALSLGLDSS
ncbi:hypothetical protein NP233_g85 [Leucocoprinus birnbaumii]|uniref:P-type ATPase A domain-containing protein n=1 Tax=Leucocoprinus birnbaumii TaxID=56174 RepID=A0AAD5W486_9AGAR|nr:hypothetical protein NP233_g85 [Leucocoprinus birnbaumii]